MVMAEDDPVRICLDELRGSDEVGAAREMARERRAALLGRERVASGLVAVAMSADDGDRAQGLALFRALIHEAGEDRENRGSLGGRFPEEAAKSIEALVAREELDADAALELTDAYARGEVEAPEALVAWLMARLEALARSEAGTGMEVFDEEIERVRQAADEDDHDLYRVVDKWLDVFPARRKAGVVRHIAGRTEDFGGRLALYWLLDPSAEVRLAAAGGINGRVTSSDGAFVRGVVGSLSAGAGQDWQRLGRAFPALSQYGADSACDVRHVPVGRDGQSVGLAEKLAETPLLDNGL